MQQETSDTRKIRWLGRITEAVRNNRKLELCLYGGIVLAVILLYSASLASTRGKDEAADARQEASADVAEADMERKLAAVLSSIRGAGRVEVMITYETGTELVPAMSTKVDSNSSESSDGERSSLTVQTNEVSEPATVGSGGGNEPIVLMEKQPVVRGVIVVAEGAADIRVKLDVQRAEQAVLDMPLPGIEVIERSTTANHLEGG